MVLNPSNDRRDPPGFIEARYYRGALPFPIHHILGDARCGEV
jgi:hypothetical protein